MMSVPTSHNLRDLKEVREKIQLLDSWSIPVSKSDDVIWNVVLAYLNSFPASDEEALTRRVQCLTGHQEVEENVKRSVQNFNPFLHRDAVFNDDDMSEIVAEFKKRVQDYMEKHSLPRGEKIEFMEACSRLLSCNIVHIFSKDKKAAIFPQEDPGLIYTDHISIFHVDGCLDSSTSDSSRFAFGVPKEIGLEKRRKAFQEILNGTRMFENKERLIQHINHLLNNADHFLIWLEIQGFREFVSLIFGSPCLLSKLADAGFETDPRAKDSEGKCAFFHALKTEKAELVSFLYDHAVNARPQTEATLLSPDKDIIENLENLRIHLQLLEERIMVEEVGEKSKCLYLDLCRFNEFQIDICESIYNIRATRNDETENKYKAVLLILEKYLDCFHFKTVESSTDNTFPLSFPEFLEHKFYFDKLDFCSTAMLFDNLFLLKEKLKLPNDAYLDLESSFCIFVCFKNFLESYQKKGCQWILFQERLSLQRQIRDFKEVLEKTEPSGDNIVVKIPEEAVLTLTNLPEIYGKFLVSRLKHYLKAATELEVKDIKSILVIERCLQVLGESCKKCDFKSVQSILALALPKDFVKHSHDIRDSLSHIESHELFYRINFEGDTDLFMKIRNELSQIVNCLLPIYSIHEYELDMFLLSHFLTSSKEFQRMGNFEVNENHIINNFSQPEMNEYRFPKTSQGFGEIQFFLQKVNDLNFKGDILHPNTANFYKRAVENLVLAIREELKSLKDPVPETGIKELDSQFWCFERVLNCMLTDRKITEKVRSVRTSMIKDRNILFEELLKNDLQSQNKNQPTESDTEITPEERDRVGEELSSEPEDSSSEQNVDFNDPFMEHGVVLKIDGNVGEKAESFQSNSHNNENNILQNMRSDHRSNETNYESDFTDFREKNNLSFTKLERFGRILRSDAKHIDAVNGDSENLIERDEHRGTYSIEDAANILNKYEGFARTVLPDVPEDSTEDFHFQNIKNYCSMLKGKYFLKQEEKEIILASVPEKFQSVPETKQKIRNLLREKMEFTQELQNELSTLKIEDKKIKEIKVEIERYGVIDDTLYIVDSARDYFSELKEILESEEKIINDHELFCEKLELPEDSKNILLKLVPERIAGNKFEFFRNRIKLLKSILIDEQDVVSQLWERATTREGKLHAKEEITRLYLNDLTIQASTETLLFHCMSVSRNKKLRNIWKKTNNFFRGINLRNVLAHGHPLLETLGASLDPDDLPSELVGKVLQLISDECLIDCMSRILEKSGTDQRGFLKIMDDEKNPRFRDLREKISECDRWKTYAILIPVNSGRDM